MDPNCSDLPSEGFTREVRPDRLTPPSYAPGNGNQCLFNAADNKGLTPTLSTLDSLESVLSAEVRDD